MVGSAVEKSVARVIKTGEPHSKITESLPEGICEHIQMVFPAKWIAMQSFNTGIGLAYWRGSKKASGMRNVQAQRVVSSEARLRAGSRGKLTQSRDHPEN